MKQFLDENFLLNTNTAQRLYHDYARDLPIIDYHNHLPPSQINEDINFQNLTQAWLYGDHYKWRAMRTNGVAEKYCTGQAGDFEKFEQWAATVPYTLRNPLYHWTHLELQRYFDIKEILGPSSAKKIYDCASEKLQSKSYSVRSLLERMHVHVICTTDDPIDDLHHHFSVKKDNWQIKMLPAFRPDKAMQSDDPAAFSQYVSKLEQVVNHTIGNYDDYLSALKKRHDFFAEAGCSVSDHGLEFLFAESYTDSELKAIFSKLKEGKPVEPTESAKFKSAMLVKFAEWDWEKGWVQQYHVGALRNNNSRMMQQLGPDTGWDSIGDFSHGRALAKFLDRLDKDNNLARTIIYNVNPADNAVMATMIGNFNDGSMVGKVQWGSAWWFLDQQDGMIQQLNTLSNMGLLSRFVGMLTDSRSFLSFPRHEYFRRILCNLFGEEIERGELPGDIEWTGKIIQNICYYNARDYFAWR